MDFTTTSKTGQIGKPVEPYLRGPIPWRWLQTAGNLGGSALYTGLAVWHLRALGKNTTFRASLSDLRRWTKLSEKATRNGLHALETGGLISVDRPTGRKPVINLIESCPA